MSDAFWVALFGFLAVAIPAIITVSVQFARAKGVQISTGQEDFIRDAAAEGIAFAEELARRGHMTPAEKLAAAVEHATKVIDRHRAVPTPKPEDLARRVEAMLPAARGGGAPKRDMVIGVQVDGADEAKRKLGEIADAANAAADATERALSRTEGEPTRFLRPTPPEGTEKP